jgi:acetate kinase
MALSAHPEPARALHAVNGGSSSIRFAMYDGDGSFRRMLAGKFDLDNLGDSAVTVIGAAGQSHESRPIGTDDSRSAVPSLIERLATQPVFASVKAVGHRIVHGMSHSDAEPVTSALLDELRCITPYDPEHLPLGIELIEAFRQG